MKISVDDQELFTLTETQKKVLKNDIPEEILVDDLKRRLQWVLMHKYEQCFIALKKEWEPKLVSNGVKSFPADPDEFAELVFAQANYKDRSTREAEAVSSRPL